jgi:hypothetical protein
MLGIGQASFAPDCANTKCTTTPRPVSWCEATNNWYRRCDKCRRVCHAKRDAAVAAAAAALQARKDAGELLSCSNCGWAEADAFTPNDEGTLATRCDPCVVKHRETCNAKRDAAKSVEMAALQARKDAGELIPCSSCGWAEADAFTPKEDGTVASCCDKCVVVVRASQKRYRHGTAGNAASQRYRYGAAGQATADRFRAKRQKRRQQSSAMRLDNAIMAAADGLISCRRKTSPTFVERTGVSEGALLAHMRVVCEQRGFAFEDRNMWQLDHKIPREAYDFDNPDDVRRCWSLYNLHAMTKADNMQKSWHLLDHFIASAGPGCFPAAWQGAPPTEDMKRAHNDKCVAAKALVEAEALESLEAPDSGESDQSDDESDEDVDDAVESDDSES